MYNSPKHSNPIKKPVSEPIPESPTTLNPQKRQSNHNHRSQGIQKTYNPKLSTASRSTPKNTQRNLGLAGEFSPTPTECLPPYLLASKNLSARIWPLVGVEEALSFILLVGLLFSFRLSELVALSKCEICPSLKIEELSALLNEEPSLGIVEELSLAI